MKNFIKFILLTILLLPNNSYGFFGMLGRDQCSYQQTPYPTNPSDYASAEQQRLRGLKEYRASLATKMGKIDNDLAQAQRVIKAYFPSPWSDAMFAHMDNQFDCCRSSTTASLISGAKSRMPAGQSNPDEYVDDTVYTDPSDNNDYTQPEDDNQYTDPTDGQQCLQTGFAAGNDWNTYACRDGGQIDPQVCSNASISRSPSEYQKCIDVIKIYKDLAAQKRTVASQIQDVDAQINSTRGNYTASNEGKKSGFLSGLGNFLGGVVSVALPFVLNQYMSYTAKKQATQNPLAANRQILAPPGAGGRNIYGPNMRPREGSFGYAGATMQPPPPYYGPNYGYAMGYGGQYGQSLPGYQTGGIGCSPGMLGGGMNMLSMLMMMSMMGNNNGSMNPMMMAMLGGGLNLNMNASLNSNFGLLGGGAPYSAMQMAYGNNYPAVSPYTMGGFTPPYQPGGIYGGTPTYIPNFNGPSVPNFYTGQQSPSYFSPMSGCTSCMMPQVTSTQPSYLGTNANAFYYAQQMANNQRMAENQSALLRRQSELEYQLYQLRMMNGQNSVYSGTNYQMGNTNGLYSPYTTFTGF